MQHAKLEVLLGLLQGTASNPEAEVLYEHLTGCGYCEGRFRELKALQSQFETTFDAMIGDWIDFRDRSQLLALFYIGEEPSVAISNVFEAPSEALRATDVIEDLGVAGPGTSRKEVEHALKKGDLSMAEAKLIDLSKLSPKRAALSRKQITREGKVVAIVVADANRRSISLLAYEALEESTAKLTNSTGTQIEMPLQSVSGASYRLAEFEDLQSGWYSLVFDCASVN